MFSRWRFPLLVAALLIAFELATIGVVALGAPDGYRWLGSTISNQSDVAYYLSSLAQGKNSLLVYNLYSDSPISRFDLFWSLGGLFVRAGLSPLLTFEILRWLCTIVLSFALVATARAVTQNEKQAGLAAMFMISGMSTGWTYIIWKTLTHSWNPTGQVPADLMSEAAIAPLLICGAHMILSFALQLLAIRWIWESLRELKTKRLLAACAALCALSLFHSYFIPLFGLMTIFALVWPLHGTTLDLSARLKRFVLLNASMLPGFLYILWSFWRYADFRTQQFDRNILPLGPLGFWILLFLPIGIAGAWMLWRKIPRDYYWSKRPNWVMAWIVSAIICMILPFPWKRKFTQGLIPAAVILTLPFWLMAAQAVRDQLYKPMRWMAALALLFPFYFLFRTQLITIYDPRYFSYFYAPIAQFHAWEKIAAMPAREKIIATSLNAGVWTPAYTARIIWIGHNHGTPDYANRLEQYNFWKSADDPMIFRSFLEDRGITTVLAVSAADTRRCGAALTLPWHSVFEENGVSVWTKLPSL